MSLFMGLQQGFWGQADVSLTISVAEASGPLWSVLMNAEIPIFPAGLFYFYLFFYLCNKKILLFPMFGQEDLLPDATISSYVASACRWGLSNGLPHSIFMTFIYLVCNPL